MKKSTHPGFTLIELLVVIAIIGILASIILASLSTARSKGNDAKVEEQMKSIQSAASIYATDNNGTYGSDTSCTGMLTDPTSGMDNLMATSSWPDQTSPVCVASSDDTEYAMYHGLSTAGTYWCVDSSGASQQTSADGADQCAGN